MSLLPTRAAHDTGPLRILEMAREQYETTWKDYYAILQVHQKAEPEGISAAYRRLALMYHPDKNHSPEAEQKFKEINEANEILSDADRRAVYELAYSRYQSEQEQQSTYGNSHRSNYQSNEQTNRNHQGNQTSDSEDSWYDEDAEWEIQPTKSSYADNPSPDNLFSFAFLKYLVNRLVDRLAPNPDESQRILPWPSWKWQRVWLLAAPPLAGLSFLFAFFNGAWGAVIFAAIFLAASIYSGKMTGWMREAREAPIAARIAGGASITLSGISWGLGIAYGLFVILMTVFMFRIMGVLLMAMLEEGLNKRR